MFFGCLIDFNFKILFIVFRVKCWGCLVVFIKEVFFFGGFYCFFDFFVWVVGFCGLFESNFEVVVVVGFWLLLSILIE